MVGIELYRRVPKMLFIFVGVVVPLLLIIIILVATNTVSLTYSGFAIDSENNLYLGKTGGKIDVYSGGKIVKSISLMTSKGYAFTIKKDKLVVAALSNIYILDLEGNILEKKECLNDTEYNKLFKEKNIFIDSEGNKFILSNVFGYYSIKSRDNNEIYPKDVFIPAFKFALKKAIESEDDLWLDALVFFLYDGFVSQKEVLDSDTEHIFKQHLSQWIPD